MVPVAKPEREVNPVNPAKEA
jgi:hypothetical protein